MPWDESLLVEEEATKSGFDPALLQEEPEPLSEEEQRHAQLLKQAQAIDELGGAIQEHRDEGGAQLRQSDLSPYQQLRGSSVGHKLFGPTSLEKQGMVSGGAPGLLDIPLAMSKFATAPPQLTEPIRKASEYAIKEIPSQKARGVVRGVRDTAIGVIGSLPAGGLLNPRALMAPFAAEFISSIPEQVDGIEEAAISGNKEALAERATSFALGAAATGYGGVHAIKSRPGALSGKIEMNRAAPETLRNVEPSYIEPPDRPISLGTPEIRTSPEVARRSPSGMELVPEPVPPPVPQEASIKATPEMMDVMEADQLRKEILSRPPVAEEPQAPISLGAPEIRASPEVARRPLSGMEMVDRLGKETESEAQKAIKSLPLIPAGHVRLFHGEGGPDGGGLGGSFYTSNPTKAASFGPRLSWVDVTHENAAAAFAKAKASDFGGGDVFILDPKDAAKSKTLDGDVAPVTHVLDVSPNDFVPALRPKGKEPIVGKKGQIHQDIYNDQGNVEGMMLRVEQPEHGFVRDGKFVTKEELGKLLGENGPVDSQRLAELQSNGTPPTGLGGQLGAGIPDPVATVRAAVQLVKDAAASPHVKRAAEFVAEATKEAFRLPKTSDYRRSVLHWSSKLQQSFDETSKLQKRVKESVPDESHREGITNWIQANGDHGVLAQRYAATTDPKLKAGYQAALQLTPEEIAVAQGIKTTFDNLGQRGQAAEVLDNFKDNYVTQIWNLEHGPSVGSSRPLKKNFRFNKARTFESYFDGEQAGYEPKTKDISKILPLYLHEMNGVIAARELAGDLKTGNATTGERLAIPRSELENLSRTERQKYRVLANQPALGDVALHKEAFNRISNVLGKSAIREWYNNPTSALAAIPKAIAKGIDVGQQETKRTMLGTFAPFHQVQEGTHAVGHRINPFNAPKIDLVNNPAQIDATKHGLMLAPDRASEAHFMDGFRTSGVVSRIPGIGPLADKYSNYLFHQYIPGIKFKTYEAILERNTKVYERQLASNEVGLEDVKILSAEQANAAYGHLNYADLGRNPTIQHLLQLGLLAPDFLEARGRFTLQAAKGALGTKVGREQFIAVAFLAASQATGAYVASKLVDGEWDPKHPFEFTKGSRRYTMRSVPEDTQRLLTDTRAFVYARLNPTIAKTAVQGLSGVDWAGRKVTAGQTLKELATAPVPLMLRSAPGLEKLTGADRPGSVSPLEQLAGTLGLKVSRTNPQNKIGDLHRNWLKNNPDPKVKKDYEQRQTETFAVSKYKALDSALDDKNAAGAKKAIEDLQKEGGKRSLIYRRFNPYKVNGDRKPLFHESAEIERRFVRTLSEDEKKLYQEAIKARGEQWKMFRSAFNSTAK